MTGEGATLGARGIAETEVYYLLSNQRRREAIECLRSRADAVAVRELSEVIAAAETGESPPPRDVRESVYASLHQTHLPKLDEAGVVVYDREEKVVRARDRAREVGRYMDVVGPAGVTWGEYYRGLSVVGLCAVVAAAVDLPAIGAVEPLGWATATLAAIALSTLYQLSTDRRVQRLLFGA